MFIPSKTKYRKRFKGRLKNLSKGGNGLNFGAYGLKALESGRVDSNQIEAARRVIARYLKKVGKIWITMFADVPVSAKPADVRMGKGKGSVNKWVMSVGAGRILFQVSGEVPKEVAKDVLMRAAYKLSIPVKFVSKDEEI